jgi:hypothetical protein
LDLLSAHTTVVLPHRLVKLNPDPDWLEICRKFCITLQNRGVFVKPEKVEVGEFPPLGLDDDLDELMEEI